MYTTAMSSSEPRPRPGELWPFRKCKRSDTVAVEIQLLKRWYDCSRLLGRRKPKNFRRSLQIYIPNLEFFHSFAQIQKVAKSASNMRSTTLIHRPDPSDMIFESPKNVQRGPIKIPSRPNPLMCDFATIEQSEGILPRVLLPTLDKIVDIGDRSSRLPKPTIKFRRTADTCLLFGGEYGASYARSGGQPWELRGVDSGFVPIELD